MKKQIKLSKWAEENGYAYTTAYKLFKEGKLPNAKQLSSGRVVIESSESNEVDLKFCHFAISYLVENYGLEQAKEILNKTLREFE